MQTKSYELCYVNILFCKTRLYLSFRSIKTMSHNICFIDVIDMLYYVIKP